MTWAGFFNIFFIVLLIGFMALAAWKLMGPGDKPPPGDKDDDWFWRD